MAHNQGAQMLPGDGHDDEDHKINHFPTPPTDIRYPSQEKLLESIHNFILPHGYAVALSWSQPFESGPHIGTLHKLVFRCDRDGKPKAPQGNKRKFTSTRATECKFSIVATRSGDDGTWSLRISESAHNHAATHAKSHPSLRKAQITPEIKQRIKAAGSKVPPAQIISSLRQEFPGYIINKRDVYNVKAKQRKEALGNKKPIQALLQELDDRTNWFSAMQKNPTTDALQRLFFVEKRFQDLLRINPEVVIMDCTYKTNKYALPLMTIVGITSIGTTFYIGFAFLSGETKC